MKTLNKLFAILIIALLCASCSESSTSASKASATSLQDPEAKYIFYFIGDGMAAVQVQLAEAALTSEAFRKRYAALTEQEVEELNIKGLEYTGLATSHASNRYITDSAAAGTALATGSKTNVGAISLDVNGNTLATVAERAKAKGLKVGVISSVSIDHATPACFYAHNVSRSNYAEISDELLTSGFDYFAGGSPRWDKRAARDGVDKATAYASFKAEAQAKGYSLLSTKAEMENYKAGDSKGVIATLNMLGNEQDTTDGSAMPYTIDLGQIESAEDRISLADFTAKGIEILDNKDGFFMMIEGGKIDWACHANDAAAVAYDVVAFDQAIGVALEFAAKHPKQTLIIVTGDHDCGGLALGFAGTGYESAFDLLASAKGSNTLFSSEATKRIKAGESFEKLLAFACDYFGFTDLVKGQSEGVVLQTMELSDYEIKILREAYNKSVRRVNQRGEDAADTYYASYGGNDPFTTTCTNLLNNKAGIDFSSFSHTAVPVMVFAQGANANIFTGYYDNTDIPKKIMQASGL